MEVKVKEQYKTPEKLNLRGNLHSYNINKTDWTEWCFKQMEFPSKARILELGCGTGDLWHKNAPSINENWTITLSDFSEGMLQSTRDRLKAVDYEFIYREIDAQEIPYEDESFDVVIARNMLYFVPDIDKALSEIHRVLTKDGVLYATTTAREAMSELNLLIEKFDSDLGLSNNGMCERFDDVSGPSLLKKHFGDIKTDFLQGKILVHEAEPIIAYKASTIKGSSTLVGVKKQQFKKFIEDRLKKDGNIAITTKGCLFKAKKKLEV